MIRLGLDKKENIVGVWGFWFRANHGIRFKVLGFDLRIWIPTWTKYQWGLFENEIEIIFIDTSQLITAYCPKKVGLKQRCPTCLLSLPNQLQILYFDLLYFCPLGVTKPFRIIPWLWKGVLHLVWAILCIYSRWDDFEHG